MVFEDNKELKFMDEFDWESACQADNLLKTVFRDGILIKEQSLKEIRKILHEGGF